MSDVSLYPAILTDSPEVLQEQLDLSNDIPEVKVVQIDIIDGFYVDNLTIDVADLAQAQYGDLKADIHILTEEPINVVFELEDVKEDVPVRSVIAQIERMTSQEVFVEEVKKNGWRAGLSLDLHTPHQEISDEILLQLDVVQVMGNQAGFQGKELNETTLEIVKEVRERLEKLGSNAEITFDVGVKLDTIEKIAKAGARGFMVGSGLWKVENPTAEAKKFISLASGAVAN